jgi:VanZ family protein
MQKIFQATAWVLAGTIVLLSLSPPSVRPTTGAAHGLEHFLIFLATGVAFGCGYSRRAAHLTIALPTFAAAIEVAQNWVPGRHARMSDFLVDAAASCLGVGLSYAFLKLKAVVIRS